MWQGSCWTQRRQLKAADVGGCGQRRWASGLAAAVGDACERRGAVTAVVRVRRGAACGNWSWQKGGGGRPVPAGLGVGGGLGRKGQCLRTGLAAARAGVLRGAAIRRFWQLGELLEGERYSAVLDVELGA